ncbi:MAG: alpha/beta hydrolase [Chitinophagaceae bacterium]|nr:alpha/beta hydrolase [Chitinophagaceae bacterium]
MNWIKNILLTGAAGKTITLDIFFNGDGNRKPVVIYAHGFNGFKDWGNFDLIASRFSDAGFALVKFNFSHNGTTPEYPEVFSDLEAFGNNNYTKQLEELLVVTNWITDLNNPFSEALDTGNIYLIGHSLGGGLSILFASVDKRIKKLVTWAAISECKTPWGSWPAERLEEWKQTGVQYYTNTRTNQQLPLYYQLYQDYQQHKDRLDIEHAIKKMEIPVLICHGTVDIAVPVEKVHQLKKWQPQAELFLVESNHVFDRQHPWIITNLPAAMEAVLIKTLGFLQ